MRAVFAAAITALVVAPLQSSTPAAPIDRYAHVRPLQKAADGIIADGMARSATFRRLVNRLERSDVIVYVDLRPDMPPTVGGALRFLAKSTTHRFLRVQLNRAGSPLWHVALLGHELQHAVEVAEAEDVVSAEGLRALYRRIGVRTGIDTYDSMAARLAGFSVRDELTASWGGSFRLAKADVHEPATQAESLGDDGVVGSSHEPVPTAADSDIRR
jgi:hypothetical protein